MLLNDFVEKIVQFLIDDTNLVQVPYIRTIKTSFLFKKSSQFYLVRSVPGGTLTGE